MLGRLWTPFLALVVAVVGVLLAWLWFSDRGWIAGIIAAGVLFIGSIIDLIGRGMLPKRPVPAVYLMEGWILTPAMGGAVAAGVIIILAVALTVPDEAAIETKKLVGALGTGITAFITSVFISWAEDDKDSTLADHISDAFYEKYKRRVDGQPPEPGVHYFEPGSPGERWVYSPEYGEISGWGRQARIKRAHGVANALSNQAGRVSP
jgi:hypothetical protein